MVALRRTSRGLRSFFATFARFLRNSGWRMSAIEQAPGTDIQRLETLGPGSRGSIGNCPHAA